MLMHFLDFTSIFCKLIDFFLAMLSSYSNCSEMDMNKPIGILGGMGPQATVDAMNKIIKNTRANCDQEHIPVITVCIPDIPDRTKSILNKNDKPLEKMVEYLRILENANVGCIIIPCNTAHFWFDRLQESTHTKMISIVESAIQYIKNSNIHEVYILATTATISTQLYQKEFVNNKINFTIPSSVFQNLIMESIYKYKAGEYAKAKEIMNSIIKNYTLKDDKKFLLACTEIPLILEDWIKIHPNLFIDATDLLIKNAIDWYQYKNC